MNENDDLRNRLANAEASIAALAAENKAIYRAGMRAGIERAATHIEWLMLDLARLGEPPATDAECARQLRALLNETASESPAPPQP